MMFRVLKLPRLSQKTTLYLIALIPGVIGAVFGVLAYLQPQVPDGIGDAVVAAMPTTTLAPESQTGADAEIAAIPEMSLGDTPPATETTIKPEVRVSSDSGSGIISDTDEDTPGGDEGIADAEEVVASENGFSDVPAATATETDDTTETTPESEPDPFVRQSPTITVNRGTLGPTLEDFTPDEGDIPCAATSPNCRWLYFTLEHFEPGMYDVACEHDGWAKFSAQVFGGFALEVGESGEHVQEGPCYINFDKLTGEGVRIIVAGPASSGERSESLATTRISPWIK